MDSSSQKSFSFVNLTHPDELKDADTQLRIRRLAMTEVGKARRKPKTKRAKNEIILEFRTSPRGQQNRTDFDRINGSSVDPFACYPIDLDEGSRDLVVNIFRQNSNHATLLRGAWWPVGLHDPATFHCVLSNSRLFIHMLHNGPYVTEDDAISLAHHSKALRIVNEKMKDPAQHTTDAIIGTITGFMCHDHMIGAFERWEQHRNAMLKILDLRGGLKTINQEELRITMSWTDLTGSHSKDIPPSLPMPSVWEMDSRSPPNSPKLFSPISLAWKQKFPMRLDWISIFDDVTQLLSLDRAFTDRQLIAATTSGSWLEPTMFRLLSIRPLLVDENSHESIIEEVCRLGTLLFLAPVWRHMGANPVWTLSFSRGLLSILHCHKVEWNGLKPILVWAVYSAAIETRDLVERNQFAFILAMLMSGMQIQEWDELLQVVKGVLWVEDVFGSSDISIRDEVMGIFTGSPNADELVELEDA